MSDADGRIGRVHALAAGAGRAHDVDTQVVLVDLDLDLLGLGHHRDRRGRGVDPPLRLGLGNALHAVRAALELEDRERALALHGEHRLLDTAALALARRERLGLEAEALGVPREHPAHVPRPERRLVAADALPDLDDHVLLVGGVALDERELELALRAGRSGLRARAPRLRSPGRSARPRGSPSPRATRRPAASASRAPSAGDRRRQPAGGRCRPQGRTCAPAPPRRSGPARRRGARSPSPEGIAAATPARLGA